MDFYVLLGLGREATVPEIRRAYRRLARKYHPDINPGDRAAEAFFESVLEAYETLNDPDRRREYDGHGTTAPLPGSPQVSFEGFGLFDDGRGLAGVDVRRPVCGRASSRGPTGSKRRGRSACQRAGSLRRDDAQRRAPGHAYALRRMRQLWGGRCGARQGSPVPALRGHRKLAVGAWAHGVLEELPSLRWRGASTLPDVPDMHRRWARGAERTRSGSHSGRCRQRSAHPYRGQRECWAFRWPNW